MSYDYLLVGGEADPEMDAMLGEHAISISCAERAEVEKLAAALGSARFG
jgi:hypothetical protein